MKTIPLTQGYEAIVDDDDYQWLSQWAWHYVGSGYAARRESKCEKYPSGKYIYMHRQIHGTGTGCDTDHINLNKLDNRRANLRTVTRGENITNSGLRSDNMSGVKGVSWNKRENVWEAYINKNYVRIRLGNFKRIKQAALARAKAEKTYHIIK